MDHLKEKIDRCLKERHGEQAQKLLYRARVAVAGVGGMGSAIATALARAGVGHLHLIDFDCVELNNLHRQQYFLNQIGQPKVKALRSLLLDINPFLDIQASCVRVTEENCQELFTDADIVIEAFDNPEAKAMLVNWVLEHLPDCVVIACSGMAGYGDANMIVTRKITEHFYLCGDGRSDVKTEGTLFASRVGICAGHAANKAIELIIKDKDKENKDERR